jgi:hypothetical protein
MTFGASALEPMIGLAVLKLQEWRCTGDECGFVEARRVRMGRSQVILIVRELEWNSIHIRGIPKLYIGPLVS